MISKEKKNEVLSVFKVHPADTGSVQVQTALLTTRIQELTDHLKKNKKDFSSRRGLLKMVGRRRRLLNYLKGVDFKGYGDLVTRLGIRK